MSIRADRYPGAFRRDEPQSLHVEILPVRIRVDFEHRPGLGGMARHLLPVTRETGAKVVDPSTRVREHLNVWIFEPSEIALGLVVAQAELRVERAEDEVEPSEDRRVHVARTQRREVHFDTAKDERARVARVHLGDVLALRDETRLVHPVRDAKGL